MRIMTMPASCLSRDEVRRFHRTGYLGPYAGFSPEEMESIRSRIESEVLTTAGPNEANPLQARHQDHQLVYELITSPAVIGRVRGLIGNDIVVWASYFFKKEPGDRELPWHQDLNFWPIEPPLNLSLWMAIDRVTTENSCVQLIPGSHRRVIPHVPARPDMGFRQEADPVLVDGQNAVSMVLEPGQFFLFNERLLHRSAANRSTRRRLGLTARYTVPFVEVLDQDSAPLFPGHVCVLVEGHDNFQLNRSVSTPPGHAPAGVA